MLVIRSTTVNKDADRCKGEQNDARHDGVESVNGRASDELFAREIFDSVYQTLMRGNPG